MSTDRHILVLAALTEATGNAITARRIAQHLEARHRVTLVDANTADTPLLRNAVADVDMAVGVHALLAGPFLRGLGVPYALVFGGTDLYEPTHELQQSQMSRAVVSASRLLAFSPENRARAEWMWPSVAGRVQLLPQAVELPERTPTFSLRAHLGLTSRDIVVLLPTGIRKVKDPLHAVEAFGVWHALMPSVHLVVVGARIEHDYAEVALSQLSDRPGIHYVSALSRPELLAAMVEADVVLNSSLSEGMCGTVLEAMALRTPVVARRNAGNESLIVHGHTGLLYDKPNELVHWISALSRSHELRTRLADTAHRWVETHHTPARERDAYLDIVRDLAGEDVLHSAPSTVPTSELECVVLTAQSLHVHPPVIAALTRLLDRLRTDEPLGRMRHELSGLLGTAPPSVAIAATQQRVLAHGIEPFAARTLYLLLALIQVPDARARHGAREIDEAVSRSTLCDLALWSRQLFEQGGGCGISLDAFAWAQRYLRGELLQFGGLQFDLRPFPAPMHTERRARSRQYRSMGGGSISFRAVSSIRPRPHTLPPIGRASSNRERRCSRCGSRATRSSRSVTSPMACAAHTRPSIASLRRQSRQAFTASHGGSTHKSSLRCRAILASTLSKPPAPFIHQRFRSRKRFAGCSGPTSREHRSRRWTELARSSAPRNRAHDARPKREASCAMWLHVADGDRAAAGLDVSMLDLVITADDLGIDPRRDDGIFLAFERGAITQSSLLVAGRSAEVVAARVRREWSIGLHLDLTETRAVAPKRLVSSLLDAHGEKLGKHGLRDAIARGSVDLAHVALEAEAQIEAFTRLMDTPPSHVDGHQHVHVIPALVETLATVFQRAGIKSTRIPEQHVLGDGFYREVSEHAAAARAIYARHGIASTDAFVGLDLMGESSDAERFRVAVSSVAHLHSAEVMTHPGYRGTGWDDFNESPAREHELEVLLSAPFAPLVAARRVTLVSFQSRSAS